MRFPLGLTANLAAGRARQLLQRSPSRPLILPLCVFAAPPNSSQPLASDDLLSAAQASLAPVVWIGGTEPLQHPEIGRLARRIADLGRHVFVETDGALIRRRIHQFRPISRLFLTARFNGLEERHDKRARRLGAFRDALEGIRIAKLSGFLVCARIMVQEDIEVGEIEKLRKVLATRDVDGFIVSPGRAFAEAGPPMGNGNAALERILGEALAKIPGRRWKWFSRLLNRSLQGADDSALANKAELARFIASETEHCEESVETG